MPLRLYRRLSDRHRCIAAVACSPRNASTTYGEASTTFQSCQSLPMCASSVAIRLSSGEFPMIVSGRQGPQRSEAKAGHNERGPPCPVPDPVRLGHRLAFPTAGLHGRPRLFHRCVGRPPPLHWEGNLPSDFQLLDQDFRGVVRHGGRLGDRHAIPDRHELESLLRRRGRCRWAAASLRGPGRILPGSGVPRRAAVRTQACAAVGAFRRSADGRPRHALFDLLDPLNQQLDADARRLRDRRRPVRAEGLAADHLQPVFSLSARSCRRRGLYNHRLRSRRRGGLLSAARTFRRGSALDAVDDAVAPDRTGSAAVLAWRRAWTQHARASAGETGGDRGHLGYAWPRSAQSVRYSRREGRDGPLCHRDPGPRQPHFNP